MAKSKRYSLNDSSKSTIQRDRNRQEETPDSIRDIEKLTPASQSEGGTVKFFLGFPLAGIALFLLSINHGTMKILLPKLFGRILYSFKNESIELGIATTIGTLIIPYLMLFATTFLFWVVWRLWDDTIPRPGRSRFNYFDGLLILFSPIILGMVLTLKYRFIG
jgi:hypothetical protein